MHIIKKTAAFVLLLAVFASFFGFQAAYYAVNGPNLVINPNFSNTAGWTFSSGTAGVSGGHFYLDPNGRVSQVITIPRTSIYELSADMATSSGTTTNSTFGVMYQGGAVIHQITLARSLNYAKQTFPPLPLQAGDRVEIYCTLTGNQGTWVNGNNFMFCDTDAVPGNLISITQPATQTVLKGTALQTIKASLTNQVAIVTDGSITSANVAWGADTVPAYDPQSAGTYILSGAVTLIDGVTNTNGVPLTASAAIVVENVFEFPQFLMAAGACTEETVSENGSAANAIDGNSSTHWHTKYSSPADTSTAAGHANPSKIGVGAGHWIEADLGSVQDIARVRYLPRQDAANGNGNFTGVRVYVSDDGINYTEKYTASWAANRTEKIAPMPTGTRGRYVLLNRSASTGNFGSCAELNVEVFDNNTSAVLLGFSAEKQVGEIKLNAAAKTIEFKVPYGTDVSSIRISAAVTGGATVTPASGSQVDFTSPVTLRIQNGAEFQQWAVTCVVDDKRAYLTSDNANLSEWFNWAAPKTNQFVMTGKSSYRDGNPTSSIIIPSCMPSYWAGYYNRTAFYGRDFYHQANGGQIIGLDNETYNMLWTFANSATQSRQWYALWAFNFDGTPYSMDYRSDTNFVRELPANFELLEKIYSQYLWSGDRRYIEDPVIFQFATKCMTDFITMHDRNGDGIADEIGTGIFNGSATYNERSGRVVHETGEAIGCQYRATLAYAGILEARGDEDGAAEYRAKAAWIKEYFNTTWSVNPSDPDGLYVYGRNINNGNYYYDFGKETSWFIPMKLVTEPGPRNDLYLDFIDERMGTGIGSTPDASNNIEAYSYLPDVYWPYNRSETAWKWMKYIMSVKDRTHENASQGTNGDYPEISFTFISHTIEGMMGLEVDAVRHEIATIPRMPAEVGWLQVDYVQIGGHELTLRHDSLTSSFISNTSEFGLRWMARFYGDYKYIIVDGEYMLARHDVLNGVEYSYVYAQVGANGSATAFATNEDPEGIWIAGFEIACGGNDTYTAVAEVFNFEETAANNIGVLIAAYDSGKLAAIAFRNENIESGGGYPFAVGLDMGGKGYDVVKAYIWHDFIPLCRSIVYEG